jgi:hypothetical protein
MGNSHHCKMSENPTMPGPARAGTPFPAQPQVQLNPWLSRDAAVASDAMRHSLYFLQQLGEKRVQAESLFQEMAALEKNAKNWLEEALSRVRTMESANRSANTGHSVSRSLLQTIPYGR